MMKASMQIYIFAGKPQGLFLWTFATFMDPPPKTDYTCFFA